MKLTFFDSHHHLNSLSNRDSAGYFLKIFDEPLIVWNIKLVDKLNKVDSVIFPEKFSETSSLIREKFPSIKVEYSKDPPSNETSFPQKIQTDLDLSKIDSLNLNINSLVYQSRENQKITIDTIQYPWDYLRLLQEVLNNHVLESKISSSAVIPKTTVIDGPCIIEDNVVIDDFCKIKGPIFIGKDCFIGMGSLVRNCMFGSKTSIGFNCEISKCYFAGQTQIAHHNVILDSVMGENVWFGGYSGTANVLLTKKNVKYQIDDTLIDTGTDHFGSVVGNNSSVGAAVIILPGRQLPANSSIQAGTIFGKKE